MIDFHKGQKCFAPAAWEKDILSFVNSGTGALTGANLTKKESNMFGQNSNSEIKSVLVLNKPFLMTENDFYVSVFRIPETLSRLRQYRELLIQNNMNVPVWVYCLTQEIRTLMGSPQPAILNFLVSLGLFDRYVAKHGWPDYMAGFDPLVGLIAGETTFEEQALLLTKRNYRESGEWLLYKVNSYYNSGSGSFCLTSLKQKQLSYKLRDILGFLKNEGEEKGEERVFQFLAPHEQGLEGDFGSCGIAPMHFLEKDRGLEWLWPIWQRAQIGDKAGRDRRLEM